jgi:sodium ion-translocating decarboxylase beta subunit
MSATLLEFIQTTGFWHVSLGNIIMIAVACVFIYLSIRYHYEPLLLIPISLGILFANIPGSHGGIDLSKFTTQSGSEYTVMEQIYYGVRWGLFPPLIFLGLGVLTDFSAMLANPKTMLLGAAAQIGIFITLIGALWLGFPPHEAASIGIIGGADGPTAIFLTSGLAPHILAPVAISAYSYMALVPIIQPPIMKLLTSKEERLIKMKSSRQVSRIEKIIFPVAAMIITVMLAPRAIELLGMLFAGNLIKESGVCGRLANTIGNSMIDIVTVLLGLAVGSGAGAETFLTPSSLKIFCLGLFAFAIASASGLLMAKLMNLFLSKENKINPLIGSAGVSAVPLAARVSQVIARQEDPHNHLLMHAMGPNVAGVIGSAIAAGYLWNAMLTFVH